MKRMWQVNVSRLQHTTRLSSDGLNNIVFQKRPNG